MRKNAYLLLIGLLSLVCAVCGPEPRPHVDLDCTEGVTPAAGTNPVLCGDVCVDVASDWENCGFCGFNCGTLGGANACVGGQCLCSNGSHTSAVACPGGTECDPDTGWCLTPDPRGDRCDEIDGIYCPPSIPSRVCVNGYCTVPDCNHAESCNFKDDDCDGLIDQTDVGQPLTETCYGGPAGTVNVGICLEGQRVCVVGTGSWTPCNGQQLPVPETGLLRCDGLDNDCDACADNVWQDGMCMPLPPIKADIVFIIDRSGSMIGTISAVVSAVQSWATSLGTNPNIRFALVDPTAFIPDTTLPTSDGVEVTLPLSDYMTFNTTMSAVTGNGTGTEPFHYATQLVLSGSLDAALGGFAPDAIHIIIAIHDESTVSGSGNDVPSYDETTVCGSVPANTILAVITYPQWFPEWDLCTSNTTMPPTLMPLSSDPATMLSNLDLIIETPCF